MRFAIPPCALATRFPHTEVIAHKALVKPEIDSPGFASNARGPLPSMLGGNPGREVAVECSGGGSDSDGVCLVRSRRSDTFFCDPEALVLSHPIGCIVEKTGAVLHCIKCT